MSIRVFVITLLLPLCALVAPSSVAAQEQEAPFEIRVKAAVAKLLEDLEVAREALKTQTARFHTEETDRANRIASLETEVQSLDLERERLAEKEKRFAEELERLEKDRDALTRELEDLTEAADSYRWSFETRITHIESETYRELFDRLDSMLGAKSLDVRVEAIPRVLALARKHLDSQPGGKILEGKALDAAGRLHDGKYAQFGPVTFFSADQEGPSGLTLQGFSSAYPEVLETDAEDGLETRNLIENGRGTVPIDFPRGYAAEYRQLHESLVEHLKKGGITMIPPDAPGPGHRADRAVQGHLPPPGPSRPGRGEGSRDHRPSGR